MKGLDRNINESKKRNEMKLKKRSFLLMKWNSWNILR